MAVVFFITHPEVAIRPDVPVPQWSLSETGRARMSAASAAGTFGDLAGIFSSTERKAIEAAELVAAPRSLRLATMAELGENDRSSTGYLTKPDFEAAADAFFQFPSVSYKGWETAEAAQHRIVHAVDAILGAASLPPGNVAIMAHGAVGTLLRCALRREPIARAHDQPSQGHYFCFERETRRVLHGWKKF